MRKEPQSTELENPALADIVRTEPTRYRVPQDVVLEDKHDKFTSFEPISNKKEAKSSMKRDSEQYKSRETLPKSGRDGSVDMSLSSNSKAAGT